VRRYRYGYLHQLLAKLIDYTRKQLAGDFCERFLSVFHSCPRILWLTKNKLQKEKIKNKYKMLKSKLRDYWAY